MKDHIVGRLTNIYLKVSHITRDGSSECTYFQIEALLGKYALRTLLSALQLHSFLHLADPLGELITPINITLILATIIYSYKTRTSIF